MPRAMARASGARLAQESTRMSTVKVLVSDKLSDAGLQVLREASDVEVEVRPGLSEDELCELIGEFDGLVIRSGTKVTPKVLEELTEGCLRLIRGVALVEVA